MRFEVSVDDREYDLRSSVPTGQATGQGSDTSVFDVPCSLFDLLQLEIENLKCKTSSQDRTLAATVFAFLSKSGSPIFAT